LGLDTPDVARIAILAAVHIPEDLLGAIAAELNEVLAELSPLEAIDTTATEETEGVGAAAMPLRSDSGPPVPLTTAAAAFAPIFRDGYYLVPSVFGRDRRVE
jgi:aspartyl-tRNA(Asn)/glutamyl-tRNA(Gln) amidotransferase subunit C